jgi:hypothetical protein
MPVVRQVLRVSNVTLDLDLCRVQIALPFKTSAGRLTAVAAFQDRALTSSAGRAA